MGGETDREERKEKERKGKTEVPNETDRQGSVMSEELWWSID